MGSLNTALNQTFINSLKQLLEYAEFAGFGPHNLKYSFAALQKISEKNLCTHEKEYAGYATLIGQYLGTLEWVSNFVDKDNFSCETDPLSIYALLHGAGNGLNHRKTYFEYLSQNQGNISKDVWAYFVYNVLTNTPHDLLLEISDYADTLNLENISETLKANLQGAELKTCLKKVAKTNDVPSFQKAKSEFLKKTRLDEFLAKQVFGAPREKYHIFAIGDSITAGAFPDDFAHRCMEAGVEKATAFGDSSSFEYKTYPMILQYAINSFFRSFDGKTLVHGPSGKRLKNPHFPTTKVLNLEEYGANSSEINTLYMEALEKTQKIKPIYSIILCGANDIGWGKQLDMDEQEVYRRIIQNIDDMVSLSKQINIQPIVCEITPTKGRGYNKKQIEPFNNELKNYFHERATQVIDTYAPLLDNNKKVLNDRYCIGDGLHLNQMGNAVLAGQIFMALKPQLADIYVNLELDKMHRLKRWVDFMIHHKPEKRMRWYTRIEYERGKSQA